MSGFVRSRSQRSGSRDSSSTFSSTILPTRTSDTPSNPSAGSARSTVCPCGSRIPSLGLMSTRFLTDDLAKHRLPASSEPDRAQHLPGPCSLASGLYGSLAARAFQPRGEQFAGDALIGLEVQLARALDHVFRQRRCRWRLVPAGLVRPVAPVLLVE